MAVSLLFWILMLLWLFLGVWGRWPATGSPSWGAVVPDFLLFVLILILGWHAFGSPIRF